MEMVKVQRKTRESSIRQALQTQLFLCHIIFFLSYLVCRRLNCCCYRGESLLLIRGDLSMQRVDSVAYECKISCSKIQCEACLTMMEKSSWWVVREKMDLEVVEGLMSFVEWEWLSENEDEYGIIYGLIVITSGND